jgi:hypothetical protein
MRPRRFGPRREKCPISAWSSSWSRQPAALAGCQRHVNVADLVEHPLQSDWRALAEGKPADECRQAGCEYRGGPVEHLEAPRARMYSSDGDPLSPLNILGYCGRIRARVIWGGAAAFKESAFIIDRAGWVGFMA